MFATFLLSLKQAGLPVSVTEYLTLMEAMRAGIAEYSIDDFYYLSRATLVKDERHLDRFDRVFGECFKGLEQAEAVNARELPEEWLRKLAEKLLTQEEMSQIEALGGFEALMDRLRQLLEEQKARHQGGGKWIGTAGTSPFGAFGYNPAGRAHRPARNRVTAAPSRSGTGATFATWMATSSSARAISASRCAGCAASRARARRPNWTFPTPSAPPPTKPACWT